MKTLGNVQVKKNLGKAQVKKIIGKVCTRKENRREHIKKIICTVQPYWLF